MKKMDGKTAKVIVIALILLLLLIAMYMFGIILGQIDVLVIPSNSKPVATSDDNKPKDDNKDIYIQNNNRNNNEGNSNGKTENITNPSQNTNESNNNLDDNKLEELEKEPVKEPAKEPAKEPIKEPSKEPEEEEELEKEPTGEPLVDSGPTVLYIKSEDFKWGETNNTVINLFPVTVYGDSIIWPDKSGSYNFVIANNTDKNAKYDVRFEEEDANELKLVYRLKYKDTYIGGASWKAVKDLKIDDYKISAKTKIGYTLEWRWIESAIDNSLAGKSYNINIIIDVTEVD